MSERPGAAEARALESRPSPEVDAPSAAGANRRPSGGAHGSRRAAHRAALLSDVYLHGTHPEEQDRLARMNAFINRRCAEAVAVRPGDRVLDVGAGLGLFARELARAVGPTGRVLGLERSAEQIAAGAERARAEGEPDLVELRRGDARELPLRADEWGSFDVVHARFLLEHVRDPGAVVGQMCRAARPGGRIVLADDDHQAMRIDPEPEGFAALWDAYQASYVAEGLDPAVGRRLVGLLHAAGAEPRQNGFAFFGSCTGSPELEACVHNLVRVVAGGREAVLATGRISGEAFDAALARIEALARHPAAAVWYAICWAEGVRPGPGA